MATQSSTLAWKTPWKEEPGRLQSMGSQRVGHNWVAELNWSLLSVSVLLIFASFLFFSLCSSSRWELQFPTGTYTSRASWVPCHVSNKSALTVISRSVSSPGPGWWGDGKEDRKWSGKFEKPPFKDTHGPTRLCHQLVSHQETPWQEPSVHMAWVLYVSSECLPHKDRAWWCG